MSYKLVIQNAVGSFEFSMKTGAVVSSFTSFGAQNVSFNATTSNREIGEWLAHQNVKSKSIVIKGTLLGSAPGLREQMKHVIAPLVESKLIYNDAYELTVYVKTSPEIERYSNNPNFAFTLYAPYPYWRKRERANALLVGIKGIFSFPWNISNPNPFKFSEVTESGYVTVHNDGEAPAFWTIVFSAFDEVVNPRVYNMETGEYVKIIKTMTAGEQLVVSTEGDELTVKCINPDGTETDGFPYLDIDSIPFGLSVGDNFIKTDAEQNTIALRASITFQPSFAGV